MGKMNSDIWESACFAKNAVCVLGDSVEFLNS